MMEKDKHYQEEKEYLKMVKHITNIEIIEVM